MGTMTANILGDDTTGDPRSEAAAEILATLVEARKLIEKPENWTQGAWARDCLGTPVPARSAEATCWCAEGAIGRASIDFVTKTRAERILVLKGYGGGYMEMPCAFNDTLDHANTLAAFDAAIASFGSPVTPSPQSAAGVVP